MRTRTWVLAWVGLVLVAGVGGLGYAAASGDGVDAIDFCKRTDGQMVVGYTYGSGDTVKTSFEQSGKTVTVSVRTTSDGGGHIGIGYMDEATFPLRDADVKILGDDGRVLDCTRVTPDEPGGSGAAQRDALEAENAAREDGADE